MPFIDDIYFKAFQQSHPELRAGERFHTNCKSESEYEQINFPGKRRGDIAYDKDGKVVAGYFPVFAKAEEISNG